MKVISTNAALRDQLMRLIKRYPNIAIATAWASANNGIFNALVKNKKRIYRAVIGTHFYQTNPDVLEQFVDSTNVRFILQPNGVFHPKIYLFWNSKAWEIIVGSPNLTDGALNKNSELSILITSEDGQRELKQEIINVIHGYWAKANTISQSDADNYRRLWDFKKPKLEKIADLFGGYSATKPAVQSRVMSMDWANYLAEIKKDKTHGFDERFGLITSINQYFKEYQHFNKMPLAVRKGIAGLPNDIIEHWGWFGSMKGAGTFASLIHRENAEISLALDKIPISGNITNQHYESYIDEYRKAFPEGRDGLATATRLLAMKRPDVFFCVDAQNKRKLVKDIGIMKANQIDYKRYWDEIIVRIMESPWWQSPEPSDPTEKSTWHARVAMLDVIYYEER